ncbi:FIST N-terminal domain-containing protein [Sulfurimonas sp.]|uniref:FIST N-terminal domain-containing protein n=1 Tax=Sulfurimonas sp. TaxID=2022749 RepID=UPI00260A1012|nr:FIST N-terminal domain-containing protein [Sulfurimonas sp.]
MTTNVYTVKKSDFSTLISDEKIEQINSSSSILIQVFSGEDEEEIHKILTFLNQTFPNSIIISSSTDGEIANSDVLTYSSVISISTFIDTNLEIAYAYTPDSFNTGAKLAKKIVTKDTKLLIAFANGLKCNGEELLDGIYSVHPKLMVAGGLSGDNSKFQRCFVGINNKLYDEGAVVVALNSKTLQVNNFYSFGWQTIGLKHTITKVEKNRVYTIDNLTTVAFYKKYLGEDIANSLPETGIEFPLILESRGFKKARAATAMYDDGSLSFAGNIEEGTEVYLGIGEAEAILSNPLHRLGKLNVESFFIYSCMARRRFLPHRIVEEIEPFAKLAPTSGFFTYGEFYTHKKPELLNQTLTAIALSESTEKKSNRPIYKSTKTNTSDRTFQALRHILNITSQELHTQTLVQRKINNELEAKTATLQAIQQMANLGSWELNLKTMHILWSDMNYKIYNIDKEDGAPSYKEFINMVIPEDREKFLKIQDKLYDGKIHSIEIRVLRNDGKIIYILESGKLILHNGKPIKIVGTSLDLTNIRVQDSLLIQQAKYAQMGEMINMVAHQWRQPLNAISAAAIKLNIQSQMDILTEEEITSTSNFIEEMTQKMSQTINDFMNFTKPTNKKESIIFNEIFQDIFNIIGTQLSNHNIKVNINIETEKQLYTYKKELEHILINIIGNARDAYENVDIETKEISIRAYVKDKQFIIKISDNAGGIDEAIIDRIFEPYFTTKETNKGTGLGLYMSKKILQDHLSGDIFADNEDNGAVFTIIMDMKDE